MANDNIDFVFDKFCCFYTEFYRFSNHIWWLNMQIEAGNTGLKFVF